MFSYSISNSFNKQEIVSLFKSVGWKSADYPGQLFSSITNSETVVSARNSRSELIGLMTAVSDGGMNVFFPYLLVNPRYQGRGAGKNIVEIMLGKYIGTYRKILICNTANVEFYKKCGFEVSEEQFGMIKITPPKRKAFINLSPAHFIISFYCRRIFFFPSIITDIEKINHRRKNL